MIPIRGGGILRTRIARGHTICLGRMPLPIPTITVLTRLVWSDFRFPAFGGSRRLTGPEPSRRLTPGEPLNEPDTDIVELALG